MAPKPAAESTSTPLKTAAAAVDLTKNILLIAGLLYAFIAGRSAMQRVMGNVRDGKQVVTDVVVKKDSLELKLSDLHEVQQHLDVALKDAAKTTGKSDQPASGTGQNILAAQTALNAVLSKLPAQPLQTQVSVTNSAASPAGALGASSDSAQPWVYLGEQRGEEWRPNNFSLHGAPRTGTTVKATTDVYKRDTKPHFAPLPNDPSNWNIGKPIGVVHQNTSIKLNEILPIVADDGGTDWWARIN